MGNVRIAMFVVLLLTLLLPLASSDGSIVLAQSSGTFNICSYNESAICIQSTADTVHLTEDPINNPCCDICCNGTGGCLNWTDAECAMNLSDPCFNELYNVALDLDILEAPDGIYCSCGKVGQQIYTCSKSLQGCCYSIFRTGFKWYTDDISDSTWQDVALVQLRFYISGVTLWGTPAADNMTILVVAPHGTHQMANLFTLARCDHHQLSSSEFAELTNGLYTDVIANAVVIGATSGWITVTIPKSAIENQDQNGYAYLYLIEEDDYNSIPVSIDESARFADLYADSNYPVCLNFYSEEDMPISYENITCVNSLVAIPLSSTEIALSWVNSGEPNTQTVIQRDLLTYPTDPIDGTRIYEGNADHMTDNNLLPGTTYYYRAWTQNTTSEAYSLCYDQDYATTLAGKAPPDDVPMPPDWFQTPNCKIFEKLPVYSGITGMASGYQIPLNNFCLFLTLCGILTLSLGVWRLSKQGTIAMAASSVLIIVAAIAGVMPLWILLPAFILGGVALFIWYRT
jgi:hypothetical protein